MAGFAHIATINMTCRLTGSGNIIVATAASLARNTTVIKHNIPVQGSVAGIASRCGAYMGWVFADGGNAVVATFTRAESLVVIDKCHRCPAHYGMAS